MVVPSGRPPNGTTDWCVAAFFVENPIVFVCERSCDELGTATHSESLHTQHTWGTHTAHTHTPLRAATTAAVAKCWNGVWLISLFYRDSNMCADSAEHSLRLCV